VSSHLNSSSKETGGLFQALARHASTNEGRDLAVVQRDRRTTYAELVACASDFCERLERAGVQPGDGVAALLGNSTEFLVAAFGIWKRGAVLVPLNPQLPEAELLRYVSSAPVRAVITSLRNRSVGEALQASCSQIDNVWFYRAGANAWEHAGPVDASSRIPDNPASEANIEPDSAAIRQYSTGSTGYPKRVTRFHGQLLGEFRSVAKVVNATRDDRILGVAPFFHSHGLMNSAVLALLSGGTLYPVETFFQRDVARLIESERISVFPGVPFMFQLLAELTEQQDFSSLRCVLSAGAPLPDQTAQAFRQKYDVGIRQLYGSTETGVICIGGSWDGASEPGTVGPPIPGVSVRVADDGGRSVTAGMEGRVEIKSPFAALGYDSASEGSESHFEAGAFYPGDLGRMTPSGELVVSGRYRGFINVGGNKVDPAEVEAVLLAAAKVTEVVVFGIPDGAAGEKIKAVVVASAEVTPAEIRAHCMRRLADFKQPRIIEFRKELPKSPLGKILRKYLMDESSSGQSSYEFDMRSRLKLSSHDALSPDGTLRWSMLAPFLRVLLVTDGTVTRTLEAYFGEPIDVDVLSHAEVGSERSYPDIDVAIGDPIVRRCVTLRGRITRTIYAFAESVVVTRGMPEEVGRKLIEERKGIGELLGDSRLETYRELLSVGRTQAAEWALHLGVEKSASVLVRSYRIFSAGSASIAIQEVFPESRFAN
jgi:long-chain acyl-CoA synthetase